MEHDAYRSVCGFFGVENDMRFGRKLYILSDAAISCSGSSRIGEKLENDSSDTIDNRFAILCL